MPDREELTDALIALIPEDGSRISDGEIKAAVERQLGAPVSDQELDEARPPEWPWARQTRHADLAVD